MLTTEIKTKPGIDPQIIVEGNPYPLGATWNGEGVNFAIYSQHATKVELCLFTSAEDAASEVRIQLPGKSHHIHHGFIRGLKPGQLYGYRIHGAYAPEAGHRFNSNKLLIDPYAKALSGQIKWNDSLFGYIPGHKDEDGSFSYTDSAAFVPKSVVIAHNFDWQGDSAPKIPYNKSVIYEAHVKGFTKMRTDLPEEIRGTYAGIAHPSTIEYLKELGITALELMPVHAFVADRHLSDKGLTNYWGYNTIGFFAPDARYSSSGSTGDQVIEFKNMVRALHKANIEVILDVVYNHTAEGNHLGPTLCFRGVDNATYYRLTPEDKKYYMDYTGTGNTLNARLPNVLRLIMDSLRYWIQEMHVDGFRFDLAAALARELHDVDQLSAFFDIIYQDPVISQVKLIAEPWDVGEGGYQIGNFPPGWAEWNGKYRDCMRAYWRCDEIRLTEFAQRFTGSADLYQNNDRTPGASINFVTAHDGFTLDDLVSYSEKHNEANGESNMDGSNDNLSVNWGIEGATDNEEINNARKKHKQNILATLMLSQGVPLLLGGDEVGNTQFGNNNAYCQDNELSWINWNAADRDLLNFTKHLIKLRQEYPVFCKPNWFRGHAGDGEIEDIAWFFHTGEPVSEKDWSEAFAKTSAVFLNGKTGCIVNENGHKMNDSNFYIIFNAYAETTEFRLPQSRYGDRWMKWLDTNESLTSENGSLYRSGDSLVVPGRSIVLLRSHQGGDF
jgi:isoamylase